MIIVLGFIDHNRSTPPEVVYCGNDGNAAAASVAARPGRYVRCGKLVNPQLIPVTLPAVAAPEPVAPAAPVSSESKPSKSKK